MPSIQRYILRQLTGPFVFFFLGLSGVLWLTQSLRTVDWIVNKGLSLGYFLYLTALMMPALLTIVLPVVLFITVLYCYHRLSMDSELVVMWSSGISTRTLARPALVWAAAVTVVTYALTLYLMPAGYRHFQDTKRALRSDLSFLLIQEGTFTTIGSRLTVYVRDRQSDGTLRGILVHDNREAARPVTMMAESGSLVEMEDGPRFVLVKGSRQQIDQNAGKLSMLYFDSYVLDLKQFIDEQETAWREANERFMGELLSPGTSQDDLKNADRFRAEAHDRLVAPLYALVFTLIALSGVLSGQFRRRGYGWRISMAIGAAVLVRLAGVGFTNLAAKVPELTPLMYLNVLLAIAVSTYLLSETSSRRAMQRRRKAA